MGSRHSKKLAAKDVEIEKLTKEKANLAKENDILAKERDRMTQEKVVLTMERNGLKREKEKMDKKLKKVEREKSELEKELECSLESMADQSEDLLACSLCYYAYNKTSHVPTVGSCGHTICSQCTRQLSDRQCPICRAAGSFSKPSKNFFACDLLLHNRLLKDTQINSSQLQSKNTILLIGGLKNYNNQHNITILSQDRSRWREVQLNLPYNELGCGAVYLNDEIYLIGGVSSPKITYKLDKNLEWIRLADMNIGRRWIANSCLAWNGCIWILGGQDENKNYLKSVERYDPKENKWALMPEMNSPRASAAAVAWKDRIIVIGGQVPNDFLKWTAECYYPENRCWFSLAPMPTYAAQSLVSYKGSLITMAGTYDDGREEANEKLDDVWELNIHEPIIKWKPWPALKYPAYSFAGIVLDEEIYAIGGSVWKSTKDLDRVEIFDGEKWRAGPSLPHRMSYMSALVILEHLAHRLCDL